MNYAKVRPRLVSAPLQAWPGSNRCEPWDFPRSELSTGIRALLSSSAFLRSCKVACCKARARAEAGAARLLLSAPLFITTPLKLLLSPPHVLGTHRWTRQGTVASWMLPWPPPSSSSPLLVLFCPQRTATGSNSNMTLPRTPCCNTLLVHISAFAATHNNQTCSSLRFLSASSSFRLVLLTDECPGSQGIKQLELASLSSCLLRSSSCLPEHALFFSLLNLRDAQTFMARPPRLPRRSSSPRRR